MIEKSRVPPSFEMTRARTARAFHQHLDQLGFGHQQIGERVRFEGGKECIDCAAQYPLNHTGGLDAAVGRGRVKALHELEVLFAPPDNLADINFLGRVR